VFKTKSSIPEPLPDLESLYATVVALKQAVEILSNMRGLPTSAAVTWGELVKLEVVTSLQVPLSSSSSARLK